MNSADFERRLRAFECDDPLESWDSYVVARLDGRGFTRLTREQLALSEAYNERFRDAMIVMARHVMDCGFKTSFGFTQSDELSVLLAKDDRTFDHKPRKLVSVLAGEASAAFSRALGIHGAFDCRLSLLPTEHDVLDYFRWRQEDAVRNALNSHCYWWLRNHEHNARDAAAALDGQSWDTKTARLAEWGIDFGLLPKWQKHGLGLLWEERFHLGHDPRSGTDIETTRRALQVLPELGRGDAFTNLIRRTFPSQ
jgi:tRNA(His) 5'-end guanylyltransferase